VASCARTLADAIGSADVGADHTEQGRRIAEGVANLVATLNAWSQSCGQCAAAMADNADAYRAVDEMNSAALAVVRPEGS
jgi:hypothetical protein